MYRKDETSPATYSMLYQLEYLCKDDPGWSI